MPTVSIAQDAPRISQDNLTGEDTNTTTLEWLRDRRNDWGNWISNTGARLDGFFASTEAIERSNNSFMKIGLRGIQRSRESSNLEPQFKFRLDLPALEERLKLVFESEAQEQQSLDEQVRPETSSDDKQVEDTAIGALQLKAKSAHQWSASTSVGVDLKLPADTFWRAKGNYSWDISEVWTLNLRENIYYFHSDGWGQTTQLTFERPFIKHVFRSKSEARYIHRDRKFEFAKVFSLLRELSPKRAIAYQVGALGENKPEPQVTAYFTGINYRRKLYKDWLFYELGPELLFPREDSFNLRPGISAKIEVVFSADG